ncbi:hypothetical protein N7494_001785 [Penicillium frequentans]|uniref:Uncharacterized protein n=1 Tax=Penicillium frequentans TaxID=3151616 RepID=A0AAD6D2D8_9EURO|nr:hypothetical protein N7494_001785 [Penicillium glabrum]
MLTSSFLSLPLFTAAFAISGVITGSTARVINERQTYTHALVAKDAVGTSNTPVACDSAFYQLLSAAIHISDTRSQKIQLKANCGLSWNVTNAADVTSWFVNDGDMSAFTQDSSVAHAIAVDDKLLTIRLDALSITGFISNGPSTLTVRPPYGALKNAGQTVYKPTSTTVGKYIVPKLSIVSNITGSAYTHAKSTLKEMFGVDVTYNADTHAKLLLELPGLEDSKIGFDNATVTLADGDGYYTSEYILKSDKLTGSWINGGTTYSLQQGDMVINTGDYLIKDTDSGREWSCLGGDGRGNYIFNLEVAGITYNGLPVAAQTFRTHVYIYGYNYTSDALTKYGAGTTVQAVLEPLSKKVDNPPKRGNVPVYTWVGNGDKPNLADAQADDVYITWPAGTDASKIEADDVQIILSSEQGDRLALEASNDFVISTSSSETQIAITLQNWPFEPVYTKMTITVNGGNLKGTKQSAASLTKTYDIASVYVYLAQQGGGGTTIDGTVTAYSFYGLANLTQVSQIAEGANYTLGTTIDGMQKYYAETANGSGILVNTTTAADVYDGSGVEDMNVQLIGNTVYITTRVNATATEKVNGLPVTFTKTYAGGATLSPDAASPYLSGQPGYVLNKTSDSWIYHEKWAWQSSIAAGWGGIDIQPYTGKFEWSLAKGASQQFNSSAPSVTWNLIGNISNGTTISSNGNLTIANDETADSIAVVVHSTTDKSFNGKGTVNVAVTD